MEDFYETTSIVHAQVVDSDSEDSIYFWKPPLITNASQVKPLHKQVRVWFGGAVVAGTISLAAILSGGTKEGIILTAMPSMSPMPSPSPSASPTSNEDVQQNALLLFHDLFNGENWTSQDGWSSSGSSNMCGWYGVSCGTDGVDDYIEEVELPANNLVGNLEDLIVFGKLTSLEKLDLDSNSIHGNMTAISHSLAQFPLLHEVDFRSNNLTGSVTSELCNHIGGGILRVDCDVECDCCDHEVLCEIECMDVPGWYDSDGEKYNCTWYVFW